jgi:hypothetical protein
MASITTHRHCALVILSEREGETRAFHMKGGRNNPLVEFHSALCRR